jgi:hypothetical protein
MAARPRWLRLRGVSWPERRIPPPPGPSPILAKAPSKELSRFRAPPASERDCHPLRSRSRSQCNARASSRRLLTQPQRVSLCLRGTVCTQWNVSHWNETNSDTELRNSRTWRQPTGIHPMGGASLHYVTRRTKTYAPERPAGDGGRAEPRGNGFETRRPSRRPLAGPSGAPRIRALRPRRRLPGAP